MEASTKRLLIVTGYGSSAVLWLYLSLKLEISFLLLDVIFVPWAPLLIVWSFGGVGWLICGAVLLALLYWGVVELGVWVVQLLRR